MDNFISDFDEACRLLNVSNELPDVSKFSQRLQTHIIATHKLDILLEVNNGGWQPDLHDANQRRYYPSLRNDRNENNEHVSLSYGSCVYDMNFTSIPIRLACKSMELAQFMGKNCTSLYVDLLS